MSSFIRALDKFAEQKVTVDEGYSIVSMENSTSSAQVVYNISGREKGPCQMK